MSKDKTTTMIDETIGKRLSRLRKEAGITQKELALKLNISRSAIAGYERGRLRLFDKMIIELSKILRKSTDEILGIKGNKNNDAQLSLRFLKRLKEIEKLPEVRKKAILRILDDMLLASEKKAS